MGNKINRITKRKWYVPEGKTEMVELLRIPERKLGGNEYYYKNGDEWIESPNEVVKEQFFREKYRFAYLPKKDIMKEIKVYLDKPGAEYWQKEVLHEGISNEKIYRICDCNNIPEQYGNEKKVGNAKKPKNGKSLKSINSSATHNVYKMLEAEVVLMKARAKFIEAVNSATEKLMRAVDFDGKVFQFKEENIRAVFDVTKNFSLNKEQLKEKNTAELTFLVDAKSKPGYRPEAAKQSNLFYRFIMGELEKKQVDKNYDKFKTQLNKILKISREKESQRIHKTLFQWSPFHETKPVPQNNSKVGEYDETLFIKILNEDYQISELLKKIHQEIANRTSEKQKKRQKLNSQDIPFFGIIRAHYQASMKGKVMNDPVQNYYLKHIHNYLLGRARKVKHLASQDKNMTYSSPVILKIFDEKRVVPKIRASIVNKLFLQEIKSTSLASYTQEDQAYTAIILQQKKLMETFKMKLSNVVYASVYTGLWHNQEQSDVFGAGSVSKLQTTLTTLQKQTYQDKQAQEHFNEFISEEQINHLYGAYFIRNYTLHNQLFDLHAEEEKQVIKDYRDQLDVSIQTADKNQLVAYEIERFKFNNLLTYYSEYELRKLMAKITWENGKNIALPRFDRVFNKLAFVKKLDRTEEVPAFQALRFYLQTYYEYGFMDYLKNPENHEAIIEDYVNAMKEKHANPVSEEDMSKNVHLFLSLGIEEYRRQKMAMAGSDQAKIEETQKALVRLIRDLFEIACERNQFIMERQKVSESQLSDEKLEKLLEDKITPVKIEVDEMALLPLAIYSCAKLSDISNQSLLVQTIERFLTLEESLGNQYRHLKTKNNEPVYNKLLAKQLKMDGLTDDFSKLRYELQKIKKKLRENIKLHNFKNSESLSVEEKTAELKAIETKLFANINETSKEAYGKLDAVCYKKQDEIIQLWKQGNEETKDGSKVIPRTFILEEYQRKTLAFDLKAHSYAMEKVGLFYDDILEKFSVFYTVSPQSNEEKPRIENLMLQRQELYAKETKLTKLEEKEFRVIQEEISQFHFYSNLVTYNQLKRNKRFFESYHTRFYAWNRAAETVKRRDRKTNWQHEIERQINFSKNQHEHNLAKKILAIRNDTGHLNMFQLQKGRKSINILQKEYRETFNEYLVKRRNEVNRVEDKLLKKFNLEGEKGIFKSVEKEVKEKGKFSLICNEEVRYYEALYQFMLKGE